MDSQQLPHVVKEEIKEDERISGQGTPEQGTPAQSPPGSPRSLAVPFGPGAPPGHPAPPVPPPDASAGVVGALGALALLGAPPPLPPALASVPGLPALPQLSGLPPTLGIMPKVPVIGNGWTEHQTNEGRKYYYNEEKDESTWSLPKDCQQPEQQAFEAETCWREYRIWDGRKFFHNIESKVSCWVPPPEVTVIIERVNPNAVGHDLLVASQIKRINPEGEEKEGSEPEAEKDSDVVEKNKSEKLALRDKKEDDKVPDFQPICGFDGREIKSSNRIILPTLPKTDREKRNIYLDLLKKNEIPAGWKFTQVESSYKDDSRSKIISMKQKKQVYVEYQMALRKKKRIEMQNEQINAKQILEIELLEWSGLHSNLSFDQLIHSPDFYVNSKVWDYLIVKERQEVFTKVMDTFIEKERQKVRANVRTKIPQLQMLLVTRPDIRPEMRWDEVKYILRDEDVLKDLDPLEALRVWKAYQLLNDTPDEEIQFDRDARKTRDEYLGLLENMRLKGETGVPWPIVYEKIKHTREYINLSTLKRGSTAEGLYHFLETESRRKRPRFGDEG